MIGISANDFSDTGSGLDSIHSRHFQIKDNGKIVIIKMMCPLYFPDSLLTRNGIFTFHTDLVNPHTCVLATHDIIVYHENR